MRRYKKEKDGELWEAVRAYLRSCELYSPAYNEPAWTHVEPAAHLFVTTNDIQVTAYWHKATDGSILINTVHIRKTEDE
jgi:hypothetical protein